MSLMMTEAGWKQLQPKTCIAAPVEIHEYRRPFVTHLGMQMTAAAVQYMKDCRSAVNESRAYRGLRPLTDKDVYLT